MKRLTMTVILITLASAFASAPNAMASSAPIIPICFTTHGKTTVEMYAAPTGTHCPRGYTYGAGPIATTAQLISILASVSKFNYENGTAYGKSIVHKCIATQKPSALVRAIKC
jgi:hypothetical protein